MGYISKTAAKIINEMAINEPKIDNESYWNSFDEVMSEFTDNVDMSERDSAAIYIASAIHEFTIMINEHICELARLMIEDKYKEDK